MKITKYPQSAILIEEKEKRILIDPGKFCYDENFSAEDWGKIDILLISHEHRDHCSPEAIKTIVKNNPEIVILVNSPVSNILASEEIKSDVLNIGKEKTVKGHLVKGVRSIHGDMPNGKPKPDVLGFLINGKIYHPGDTIYMEDKPKAEIVFVPISGTVVMEPADAAKFAKETGAKIAIPIHYDNPDYPAEPEEFKKEMGDRAKVLKNGESIEV